MSNSTIPPKTMSQLKVLKQKLVRADDSSEVDLAAVLDYYYDHFRDQAFLALCQNTTSAAIDDVLEDFSALPEIFGQAIPQQNVPLKKLQLPDYTFLHGDFTMKGKKGVVLYFDDVSKGLVALVWTGRNIRARTFTLPPIVRFNRA